jgi:hypothetical protein
VLDYNPTRMNRLYYGGNLDVLRVITKVGARALLILPAVALLGFILIYGVGAPHWDHLASAEIFDRWYTHRLTLEFLLRQHNEHRTTVPRLIVLGLGLLTHFNNKAEMLVLWVSECAVALMMLVRFKSDVGGLALLLFAPIGWMIFSLRPYELLFDADGPYFSILFLVASLTILASQRVGWTQLIIAATSGLLASFSQTNGLLVWPVGALIIGARIYASRDDDNRYSVLWHLTVWVITGLAVVGSYFHGYVDPANHPSSRLLIQHPALAVKFFAVLSAGSLAPEASSAAGLSILLFVLEIGVLAAVAVWWARDREQPPFGVFLILTAIAMNVMITVNRAGGVGASGGLTSRYAAYSAFAPMGVYWCAVARRDRVAAGRAVAVMAGTLLVIGYLAGSIDTLALRNWLYGSRRYLAYELYTAKYQPLSTLSDLYPNPYHARAYAQALEQYRLSVFAKPNVDVRALTATETASPFALQWVNGKPFGGDAVAEVGPDDPISLRGWALDADGRRGAGAVFVNVDGGVDLPGCVGLERDTIRESVPRSLKWTAFGATFGGFVLMPGHHLIRLKIVSADRNVYFLTRPLLEVIRR